VGGYRGQPRKVVVVATIGDNGGHALNLGQFVLLQLAKRS